MILTMIGTISFAQVIFQIQAPSTPANLLGSYPILDWALQSNGWSSPDMNIPANAITGELMFVDDGDVGLDANGNPAGQDACTPLINGASLSGKIAVLYRGACEFGMKARHAENAGAIGVVIISHNNDPIGMLGGDSGLVVTIPVIIIAATDGAYIQAAVNAGTITQAFIGNKFGVFADDLGSRKGDVLRARRFSNLANLSQNASEFSVPLGAWVRNFGNQTQSGATLAATIDNGTQIYNQSANIPTVAPGDSVWVSLPTFSQSSYPVGMYTMEYTITTNPNADGEPSDNVIDASFMISDSLYSIGRLDSTGVPLTPSGSRAGGFTNNWEYCVAFQDPHAHRATSLGMTVSHSTNAGDSLNDGNTFFEIIVYQWNDVFTDVNDPSLDFLVLTTLDQEQYVYSANLQDVPIFVPHTAPIVLVDNTRYLFCLSSISTTTFAGMDNQIDYTTTQNGVIGGHLQPTQVLAVDGAYSMDGFQPDYLGNVLAASIKMDVIVDVDELVNEITINPYPNPTANEINIPVGDRNGAATIEIFDIAGKLVISNAVTFNKYETLKVNVANISNGSYLGKMTFEDGTTAKFNVVVTR